MKKNIRELIGFLLILALMIPCLAACRGETKDVGTNTVATTVDSSSDDSIPDSPVTAVDYEGYTFRVFTHEKNDSNYGLWEFYTEGYNGEPINDEVYVRNAYIEDKYNINFEFSATIPYAFDAATIVMQAGEDAYDLILPGLAKALEWAGKGYLTEVHTISNLDLTEVWWDQNYLEASSVEHRNYGLIGSLNLLAYDATAAGFFNKNVVNEFGLENPYDFVNNGTWTMEKMFSMGKSVAGDSDGDADMGVNDRYIMAVNSFAALTFSYGANIQLSSKDDKDVPTLLSLDASFINHFQNMVEKISKNPDVLYAEDYGVKNRITIPQEAFQQNRVFFTDGTLLDAKLKATSGVNYGLVPLPKASEQQKEYGSFIHYGNSSVTVIPRASADTARTGRILEDIAYYSYYHLYPTYLENTVKTRYSRDPESSKNVDLVINSICYDFVNMMNLDLIEDLRLLMNSKDIDIVSKFNSNQRTYSLGLRRLVQGIQSANKALEIEKL